MEKKEQAEVALTPPMGYNSFICYGATVTESEVRANADILPTGHLRLRGPFGTPGKTQVRDCWQKTDLVEVKGELTQPIPAHGSKLYKFSE